MIERIKIENFKNFEHFEFDGFKRINLIAGKNNVGKTNLLEAIHLAGTDFDSTTIRKILRTRKEVHNQFEYNELAANFNALQSFVPFRKINPAPKTLIELGNRKRLVFQLQFTNDRNEVDLTEVHLGVEIGFPGIYTDNWNLEKVFNRAPIFPRSSMNYSSMLEKNPNNEELRYSWNKLVNSGLDEEVKPLLKLLDPKFNSFTVLHEIDGSYRIVVSHEDFEGRIPLGSFGDGFSVLFHFLMGLVNSNGGIFLIDEIENGFHFSFHEKLWRFIFETGEKTNVQIFATTHSRDCIEAFSKVSAEFQGQGQFIRLEENNGKIEAIDYNEEERKNIVDFHLEVR
jgi:AAA15 family ATPase/GTPase